MNPPITTLSPVCTKARVLMLPNCAGDTVAQYLPPALSGACNRDVTCTPNDHFTAGPHCRVIASARGRVDGAGRCPTVRAGIVSPASVERRIAVISAPNDHFTAGPDCRVTARAVGALVVLVAIQLSVLGLYLPPVFNMRVTVHPPQTIISLPVQTAV